MENQPNTPLNEDKVIKGSSFSQKTSSKPYHRKLTIESNKVVTMLSKEFCCRIPNKPH